MLVSGGMNTLVVWHDGNAGSWQVVTVLQRAVQAANVGPAAVEQVKQDVPDPQACPHSEL